METNGGVNVQKHHVCSSTHHRPHPPSSLSAFLTYWHVSGKRKQHFLQTETHGAEAVTSQTFVQSQTHKNVGNYLKKEKEKDRRSFWTEDTLIVVCSSSPAFTAFSIVWRKNKQQRCLFERNRSAFNSTRPRYMNLRPWFGLRALSLTHLECCLECLISLRFLQKADVEQLKLKGEKFPQLFTVFSAFNDQKKKENTTWPKTPASKHRLKNQWGTLKCHWSKDATFNQLVCESENSGQRLTPGPRDSNWWSFCWEKN